MYIFYLYLFSFSACKSCNYGQTQATSCGGSTDTICRPCLTCDSLHYEAKPCTSSSDTICNSCKVCEFVSIEAEEACSVGSYIWWRQENCCKDSEGNMV